MKRARASLLENAFTVGAFTALSRVLGLVREMLQSRLIGAGVAQSAFTLAFALPNMARKLFGEGALTAAFVPVFKSELENSSREEAALMARRVLGALATMLGAALALAFLSVDAFERIRSWTGAGETERFRITVSLVKLLLPYMFFICAAAFGMGVVNAMGKFKASSAMPCLLNVCWIGALVWMWAFPSGGPAERVRRVAWAILAAGALQMLFMFWAMGREGVRPAPLFSGWRSGKAPLVWRNTAVAALGAGAVQINYMLDQVLAQLAAPWAAGVIGYAERLMDLPLGIIGVAFGTVLLPALSGFFAKGDGEGARGAMRSSLVSLLFVMVPAAAGLAVLAGETTEAVYQGGAFDPAASLRVSRALAVYAAGLGFFGVHKVAVPWFQAQGDMKTPLRVSVAAVFLNAALNIASVALLGEEWRHVGLAASTVVCGALSAFVLLWLARRRNGELGLSAAVPSIVKICVSSAFMAGVLVLLKPWAAAAASRLGARAAPAVSLAILVAAGAAAYAACAACAMRRELAALRRRRRAPAAEVRDG